MPPKSAKPLGVSRRLPFQSRAKPHTALSSITPSSASPAPTSARDAETTDIDLAPLPEKGAEDGAEDVPSPKFNTRVTVELPMAKKTPKRKDGGKPAALGRVASSSPLTDLASEDPPEPESEPEKAATPRAAPAKKKRASPVEALGATPKRKRPATAAAPPKKASQVDPFDDNANFPFPLHSQKTPTPEPSPLKSKAKRKPKPKAKARTVPVVELPAPATADSARRKSGASAGQKRKRAKAKAISDEDGTPSDGASSDYEEERPKSKSKSRTKSSPRVSKTASSSSPTPSVSYQRQRSPTFPLGLDSDSEVEDPDKAMSGFWEQMASLEDVTAKPAESEGESEDEDEDEEEEDVFIKTSLPDGVNVEDFVYAKYRDGYFVSQLISFDPADTLEDQRRGRDYCVVMDANGTEHKKKLSEIISSDDPAIADCKLGKFMMVDESAQTFTSDANSRPPTPAPSIPLTPDPTQAVAPLPPDEFADLERVDQLRLIRPHLQAILDETYEPAQWRVDSFYGNNKSRGKLNHEAAYGNISEREVDLVILPELLRWTLRADRWKDKDPKRELEEPPRPTGSARFNALDIASVRQFINHILLPEAIIHLCLRSYDVEDFLETIAKNAAKQAPASSFAKLNDGLSDDSDLEEDLAPAAEAPASASRPRPTPPPSSVPRPSSTASSPLSSPTPSPTPPRTLPVLSPKDLYEAARAQLTELRGRNLAQTWSLNEQLLRRARVRMREKLGLHPEGMTAEEKNEWYAQRAGTRGRVRKAKVIKYWD
ncbi:hypothetical protein IAT38_003363 [Cryptococcus sp. DSM 104549]